MQSPLPNQNPGLNPHGLSGPTLRPVPKSSATPAGFWIRFVAYIIDGVILTIIKVPLTLALHALGLAGPLIPTLKPAEQGIGASVITMLVSLAMTAIYFGWFSENKGATPGKLVLNLRLVDFETGGNVSFGRAALRETVGMMINVFTLNIGYFMVGLRSDKRGLHDLIFKTEVIKNGE